MMAVIIGGLLSLSVAFGAVTIWRITFSLHWLLLGIFLTVIGYSAIQMAILARVLSNFMPEKERFYRKIFNYNKATMTSIFLFFMGLPPLIKLVFEYVTNNFRLSVVSNDAVLGLLAVTLGFQTFTFALLFNLAVNKKAHNGDKAVNRFGGK